MDGDSASLNTVTQRGFTEQATESLGNGVLTELNQVNALYDAGMTGVGQQYESLIELAIKRTNLRDAQVKVSLVY